MGSSSRMVFVSYPFRLLNEAVPRPYYGYCIYNAALMAEKLGYKKISIIEFGVAGGNGLVNIEYHVKEIKKFLDIDFEIYGFDSSVGLPKPSSYKDLPYLWQGGLYKMNEKNLKKKLKYSKLIIGNVAKTVQNFKCAPIGAIMFDLDYYSSTKAAFKIFNNDHLPRVYSYFDDVDGNELSLYNEYSGALLAIKKFNKSSRDQKITHITYNPIEQKNNLFIFHDFKHKKYKKKKKI